MFGFFCPLACAITYNAAGHHHEAAAPATDHRGCAGARCIVIAWSSGMTYVCQSAHPITFAQPGTMALVHNAQCYQDAELLSAACTGNSVRDRGMQLPMRRAPMPWVSLPHARRSNNVQLTDASAAPRMASRAAAARANVRRRLTMAAETHGPCAREKKCQLSTSGRRRPQHEVQPSLTASFAERTHTQCF